MAVSNGQEFNTDILAAMSDKVDWHQKNTWACFASVVSFTISIALVAQQGADFQDSDFAYIVRSAAEENTIFVGEKDDDLFAMFYGTTGSVIAQYNAHSKVGSYQIMNDITSQGKMTIFILGDYKEKRIISSFRHIDIDSYTHEYQSLAEAFMND